MVVGMQSTVPLSHRHLFTVPGIATCVVVAGSGFIHATPIKVALTQDATTAVALISSHSQKARILERQCSRGAVPRASFAEHTASHWISLEGSAALHSSPAALQLAREAYRQRFGEFPHWGDLVLALHIDRVLSGT